MCPSIHTSADNRAIAGKCEAIETVVDAMKAHLDNVNMCRSGCGVLWNITFNNCKHKKKFKKL